MLPCGQNLRLALNDFPAADKYILVLQTSKKGAVKKQP